VRTELIGSRDHVFDGKILNRDKPDYQLCDIEDSLIKRYIYDERLIHDHCDVSPSAPLKTDIRPDQDGTNQQHTTLFEK
jgi:hypothetical protein